MKLKENRGKVGTHGEIRIPEDYQKDLGLYPGKEYEIRPVGQGMLIEPVKEAEAYKKGLPSKEASPLRQLSGILEIDDPDVEELIRKETWYD